MSFWNFLPPDELNAILTLYTQGHAEDPADLEDARHRGQEAPDARGRLRGAEGVQPRLRGHQDRRRGHAPRVPGAAAGGPRARGAPQAAARRDLQRAQAAGEGRARRVLLLRASGARQGGGRVHRGGRHDPLVPLRPRPRRDPRGARRDRRQHPLEARHAARSARPRRRPSSRCAARSRSTSRTPT